MVLALHPPGVRDGQDLHPRVSGLLLHDQILPDEGDKRRYFERMGRSLIEVLDVSNLVDWSSIYI